MIRKFAPLPENQYPKPSKSQKDVVGQFNPIFHNQEKGDKYFRKKKKSEKRKGIS